MNIPHFNQPLMNKNALKGLKEVVPYVARPSKAVEYSWEFKCDATGIIQSPVKEFWIKPVFVTNHLLQGLRDYTLKGLAALHDALNMDVTKGSEVTVLHRIRTYPVRRRLEDTGLLAEGINFHDDGSDAAMICPFGLPLHAHSNDPNRVEKLMLKPHNHPYKDIAQPPPEAITTIPYNANNTIGWQESRAGNLLVQHGVSPIPHPVQGYQGPDFQYHYEGRSYREPGQVTRSILATFVNPYQMLSSNWHLR
jgi:hypothetical protein